ncbi:hypothetical protein EUX98_g1384 [Antrodiella citrinella]|uniref:Transcription factor domain-containing protein n=1 Tax=Antrodiella citrinella TaxID=2447956 RepID=A0A4S4N4H7_9APHY|nr:hypothetical protein EUX98_g1384 [Antrodiella citrinella]
MSHSSPNAPSSELFLDPLLPRDATQPSRSAHGASAEAWKKTVNTFHAKNPGAATNSIVLHNPHTEMPQLCPAQQLQDQLLADAVRQITYSLVITDTDTPTHDIIAFIQAEVLLANYFFTHDRVLEGKYHSSAALSLALSCKLNLRPSSQYQNSGSRTLLSGLPPPEDHIQLGERVNAFWTVHSLYQTWAVVLDSAASLWAGEGSFGARVEIPWPLSMDTCEKGQLSAADMEDRNIVMRFLNREDRPELISLPPLALYCRAAILFANASRLASKYNSNMFHQDRATFSEQFQCLHACITMFLKEITTLELIRPLRAFLVISVLTRVALIRLHEHRSMDNHSRETCLAAANGILTLLQRVKKNDFTYIDPIVAVLLYSTGDVYVTETARYKGSLKNNIGAEDRTYTGSLAASAEQLLIVMEELEPICPLLASRRRQFVVAVSSM